jgi:hypothetical protein
MSLSIPSYITHYYEEERGPLKSVSALPREDAREVIRKITALNEGFSNNRPPAYIDWRLDVEDWLLKGFKEKGGKPAIKCPHYFVLGHCDWLLSWYKNGRSLKVNLQDIPPSQITFTYPDSMVSYQLYQYYTLKNNPYFKEDDHREYHGKVYLLSELKDVITKHGLPKGHFENGQASSHEMYIEIQVWAEF